MKTGNVPPEDIAFEELHPGMELDTGTLRRMNRSTSRVDAGQTTNYYQRKRELEKKIATQDIELSKGSFESSI